jgi:hypothetical protein
VAALAAALNNGSKPPPSSAPADASRTKSPSVPASTVAAEFAAKIAKSTGKAPPAPKSPEPRKAAESPAPAAKKTVPPGTTPAAAPAAPTAGKKDAAASVVAQFKQKLMETQAEAELEVGMSLLGVVRGGPRRLLRSDTHAHAAPVVCLLQCVFEPAVVPRLLAPPHSATNSSSGRGVYAC